MTSVNMVISSHRLLFFHWKENAQQTQLCLLLPPSLPLQSLLPTQLHVPCQLHGSSFAQSPLTTQPCAALQVEFQQSQDAVHCHQARTAVPIRSTYWHLSVVVTDRSIGASSCLFHWCDCVRSSTTLCSSICCRSTVLQQALVHMGFLQPNFPAAHLDNCSVHKWWCFRCASDTNRKTFLPEVLNTLPHLQQCSLQWCFPIKGEGPQSEGCELSRMGTMAACGWWTAGSCQGDALGLQGEVIPSEAVMRRIGAFHYADLSDVPRYLAWNVSGFWQLQYLDFCSSCRFPLRRLLGVLSSCKWKTYSLNSYS